MGGPSPVGEYLRARRALVSPEDVGLPVGRRRRVQGLRREEVAQLADISPEYYLRLEQGRDHQPSAQVLEAIARALRLDTDGRAYLDRLVRSRDDRPRAGGTPSTGAATTGPGAPRSDDDLGGLRDLLAQWDHTPAFVADRNLDVVLSNPLADALGRGGMSPGANVVVQLFAEARRDVDPDWRARAVLVAGALRMSSDPADPRLRTIVAELSAASADFRSIWARQDVHVLAQGSYPVDVPPFGTVVLRSRSFALADRPGHTLTTLFPGPDRTAGAVLAYLAGLGTPPRTAALPV